LKTAINVLKEILSFFFDKPIARSAAALSYYITLSIFPFLICASVILGTMDIQESDAFALLDGVLTEDAFKTLSDYLIYISGSGSQLLFTLGLAAMLTSSSAAFRTFTGIMGEIQGKMRFSGVWGILISFIFSIMLLAAIYGSAIAMISGEWLMHLLETYFAVAETTAIWRWIRFVIMFLLLFGVIYGMYLVSAPKHSTRMSRLPGALAAAITIVATSIVYSQLITASIRYEVLYGSLASFIILMVWLYTCSLILIVANVFNISASTRKEERNLERSTEAETSG